MNVKDNVAVVTGGASGIGLGRCSRFAKEGAHVVLSDLSQESCEREAAPIGAFPGLARRQRTITKQQVFARDHDLESPSAERNRPETQREKAGAR